MSCDVCYILASFWPRYGLNSITCYNYFLLTKLEIRSGFEDNSEVRDSDTLLFLFLF